MCDDLIETLRDCANALGEVLPSDHGYRKILERANRLLDRHDALNCVSDASSSPDSRPEQRVPGYWMIAPRNGGQTYTSMIPPDSWELRECDIHWVPGVQLSDSSDEAR